MDKLFDILGNEVRVGDKVKFMQIKYRGFMDGVIKSMASCSALIAHEKTNTCRTESRQCYSQMISLSALERKYSSLQANRAYPEPKPLTLDELKKRDGKPVYIIESPDWGHWELSTDAEDYLEDRDPDYYGMKHNDPAGRYGLHALGWLAYDRDPGSIKPEPLGCECCLPTEKIAAIDIFDSDCNKTATICGPNHCPMCGRRVE